MKLFKLSMKLFLKVEFLVDYELMELQILLLKNFKIMLNQKILLTLQLILLNKQTMLKDLLKQ